MKVLFLIVFLIIALAGCANMNWIGGDGYIHDGGDKSSVDEPHRDSK